MTAPVSKAILTNWPTLKKLAPIKGGRINGRNLVYMAEIALLTRLAVGVARISQSRPSKQIDPALTPLDKRKSFYERLFMEIIGTGSYVSFLHFGSDLFANLMEFFNRKKIPQLHQSLQTKLSGYEYQKFNDAFSRMFNYETVGMVDTVLNGKESKITKEITRPTLDYFQEKLGPNLFAKVEGELTPFSKKTANRSAVTSILGGALLGAFVGGNVIQWMNDNLLAPFLTRVLGSSGQYTQPTTTQPPSQDRFQPYMDRPQQFNTGGRS